jgi:hypothetical protein
MAVRENFLYSLKVGFSPRRWLRTSAGLVRRRRIHDRDAFGRRTGEDLLFHLRGAALGLGSGEPQATTCRLALRDRCRTGSGD